MTLGLSTKYTRSWGVLPSAQRQMVGPFIFFDQLGPVEFLTG